MPPTRLLLATIVVVTGLALAPGAVAAAGDVSVSQSDDGSATVTVTENDAAVDGATVTVGTTDDNATYAGTGEYQTDANGTVGLPAPEEAVGVTITATWENSSAGVEGTLEPADATAELPDAFGDLVSSFVHQVQNETENGTGIGPMVATYVTENSPAADRIPEHAGPPEHVTTDSVEPGPKFTAVDVGPPEHAQRGGDGGPPEDAGKPDDAGKPEDAGQPGDGGPSE